MFPAGEEVGRESAVAAAPDDPEPDMPAIEEADPPREEAGDARDDTAAGAGMCAGAAAAVTAGAAVAVVPAIRFVPGNDSIATGTGTSAAYCRAGTAEATGGSTTRAAAALRIP